MADLGMFEEFPLKLCAQLTSGQMQDTLLLEEPAMVVQSVGKC